MVHFLRSHLYKTTLCELSRKGMTKADFTQSYKFVTCQTCINRLIANREAEIRYLSKSLELGEQSRCRLIRKKGPAPHVSIDQMEFKEDE